jgi:hypothetical protein
MANTRNTSPLDLDAELGDTVETAARRAGVTATEYIEAAVRARIAADDQRASERARAARARAAATQTRSEARALVGQITQTVRQTEHLLHGEATTADQRGPGQDRSRVFRLSADWRDVHALDAGFAEPDGDRPDRTWLQMDNVHSGDRRDLRAAIERALQSHEVCELEYRAELNGSVRLVSLRALPLVGAGDAVTEWLAVVADVTDPRG